MALQAQFGAMVRALWTAPELARVCAALRVRAPAFTAAEARQLRDETRWFDPQESAADRLRLLFDYSVTVAHLVMLMARARKEVERARGPVAALDAVLVRPADGTRWDDGRSARAGPDPPDGANTLGGVGFAAAAAADRAAMDSDLLAFMRCCEYGITRCCAVRARMQTLDQTRVVQFAIPFGEWANAFVPGEPARFDMEVAQRGPLMYMQPIGGGNGGHGGPPARFLVRVDARGRPVFRPGAPLLTGESGGTLPKQFKIPRPVPIPTAMHEEENDIARIDASVLRSRESKAPLADRQTRAAVALGQTKAQLIAAEKQRQQAVREREAAVLAVEAERKQLAAAQAENARLAEAHAKATRDAQATKQKLAESQQFWQKGVTEIEQATRATIDKEKETAARLSASEAALAKERARVATLEQAAKDAEGRLSTTVADVQRQTAAQVAEAMRRADAEAEEKVKAQRELEKLGAQVKDKDSKLQQAEKALSDTELTYEQKLAELNEAKNMIEQMATRPSPDEFYEQAQQIAKLQEETKTAQRAAEKAAFEVSKIWSQGVAKTAIEQSGVDDTIKRQALDKLNSAFRNIGSSGDWQAKFDDVVAMATHKNRDAIIKTLVQARGKGSSNWQSLRSAIDHPLLDDTPHNPRAPASVHEEEGYVKEEAPDADAVAPVEAIDDAAAQRLIAADIQKQVSGPRSDAGWLAGVKSAAAYIAGRLKDAAKQGGQNFVNNSKLIAKTVAPVAGLLAAHPVIRRVVLEATATWAGLPPEQREAVITAFEGNVNAARQFVDDPNEYFTQQALCKSVPALCNPALASVQSDWQQPNSADVVPLSAPDASVEFVPRSELLLALSTLPRTNPLAYCKDLAVAYQGSGMGAACRDEYQRLCVEYAARREK